MLRILPTPALGFSALPKAKTPQKPGTTLNRDLREVMRRHRVKQDDVIALLTQQKLQAQQRIKSSFFKKVQTTGITPDQVILSDRLICVRVNTVEQAQRLRQQLPTLPGFRVQGQDLLTTINKRHYKVYVQSPPED